MNLFENKNLLNSRIILTIIFLLIYSESSGQAYPSINVSVGISNPSGDLGGDLVTENDSGFIFINPEFLTDNYANTTGITITGVLLIPVDKRGIISALISGSYSYFNIFRGESFGTGIENNLSVPAAYDSRFSVSTAGFGIQVNPLSGNKISPFINSSFTLNILSLSLLKDNYFSAIFNDAFRMGVNTFAGIEVRLNREYSLDISGSYHMSNLFLKSYDGSYESRAEFGRESISINDEQGVFYSNLSSPGSVPYEVNGKTKNANWWSINLGVNIILGSTGKK